MVEVVLLVVGGVVALGAMAVKGSLASSQAEQAKLESLFDENPSWSRQPVHQPDQHLYNGRLGWRAYGRNENGVAWELWLTSHDEGPDTLSFRAPELKLPRLELVLTNKKELSQMVEMLPKLEGMLNSFVGKMVGKAIGGLLGRLGISLEDLMSFMKSAEERPAGSAAFQARHTLLTRGDLPLEKLITPEAEGLINELDSRQFGLRWGISGLIFQIRCSRREVPQFAPMLVRLGTLLTPGATSAGSAE